MTNNYVNKLSYISSLIVQNKVLNGRGLLFLLTNLNNKTNKIIWIELVYPFLCCVMKGMRV